ncbi:MAG: hypothetical protein EBR49_15700 [Betaproteobacteria bacterium]|nr:hypothetical protein [Betaproteobacteria bacterium]
MKRKQTPAELVIETFGGVRPLARELDLHASTISRWKMGHGTVPQKHWKSLMLLAKKYDKKITVLELAGISEKVA